ncbi:hypothetical protein [Microbacterium sp. USHLN186]|uniref:hypothetical protein n=1 Tax=Microbacterium sp. USHLN186 TaxID=3081286 RepID=UPI00301A422F
MTRSFDWSPLGRADDPIPGDPDAVDAGGRSYITVADAIASAARALRSMETDGDESQATDELIRNASEVADDISRAEERYRETGLALIGYAPHLHQAQHDSLIALERAREARADAEAANADRLRFLRLADGAEDAEADDHRRDAGRAAAAADDADASLAAAYRLLEDAVAHRDAAGDAAAERIEDIVGGDDLNDSWWDDWGKDLLTAITDIAGWVSTIAGVLALCVSWIPVVGQLLGGALLIVAGVAGVINALGNIVLASTGDRSWGEAIISIAGAALSVIGLGAVARSLGKVAAVARINRAARLQPLGPGENITLIPLRNANRYSVAQLRESEGLWRGTVKDLAPDTPLYRLYGGADSRQVGGSFGSVPPADLRFPHNSLGLPASNSMERMATFQIDDMSKMVNQRHALPYEGTLGGAPEYVFPRGAGVSVVDDVPFTVP